MGGASSTFASALSGFLVLTHYTARAFWKLAD